MIENTVDLAYAYHFPIPFFTPDTWGKDGRTNRLLLQAIDALPQEGRVYRFGGDIEFQLHEKPYYQQYLPPPRLAAETFRSNFIAELEKRHRETGDAWLLNKRDVIKTLKPRELLMLKLHGLEDDEHPDNPLSHRHIAGDLTGIAQYRFGAVKSGGWYDGEDVLEIRNAEPLDPKHFIASTHMIIEKTAQAMVDMGFARDLGEAGLKFSHQNHIHMSVWQGEPSKGGINLTSCKNGDKKALESVQAIVSGLMFGAEPHYMAGFGRTHAFRVTDNTIERRSFHLETELVTAIHYADKVMDMMAFAEYGLAHYPNAALPKSHITNQLRFKYRPDDKVDLVWLKILLESYGVSDSGELFNIAEKEKVSTHLVPDSTKRSGWHLQADPATVDETYLKSLRILDSCLESVSPTVYNIGTTYIESDPNLFERYKISHGRIKFNDQGVGLGVRPIPRHLLMEHNPAYKDRLPPPLYQKLLAAYIRHEKGEDIEIPAGCHR